MIRVLPLLLAVACSTDQDPRDGTFVGNPGKLGIAVVDADARLALATAQVHATALHLDRCDGTEEVAPVDAALDALTGSTTDLPGGEFCGLSLDLEAELPVVVDGATDGGTTFTVVLDPGTLAVAHGFRVDGDTLLVALSLAALDPDALEALGPDVAIGPGQALADAVGLAAEQGAELYEDVDEDGAIGVDDPVAQLDPQATPDAMAVSSDAGCGCATDSGASPWWLVLALGLRTRRRR